MTEKASTTLPATVEKIIKPIAPGKNEKAQIAVEGADHLYREIRIENTLTNENGKKVRLKQGAEVEGDGRSVYRGDDSKERRKNRLER
jgi:hypothetical protein